MYMYLVTHTPQCKGISRHVNYHIYTEQLSYIAQDSQISGWLNIYTIP